MNWFDNEQKRRKTNRKSALQRPHHDKPFNRFSVSEINCKLSIYTWDFLHFFFAFIDGKMFTSEFVFDFSSRLKSKVQDAVSNREICIELRMHIQFH